MPNEQRSQHKITGDYSRKGGEVTMNKKADKLLTAKQAADMFDVSVTTIYRMTYYGELPHIVLRRGKRKAIVRFKRESLEKFLKKNEIVTNHPMD